MDQMKNSQQPVQSQEQRNSQTETKKIKLNHYCSTDYLKKIKSKYPTAKVYLPNGKEV